MLVKKTLVIKNRQGLHARPAALFVQIANRFNSRITLIKGGRQVSGKSIMGILTLEADKGSEVCIVANGGDAERAVEELEKLLSGQLDRGPEKVPRSKVK